MTTEREREDERRPERTKERMDVFGIALPKYIGKLVVPLMTGGSRGGLTVVDTDEGRSVALVIDDLTPFPDFERDLALLAATVSTTEPNIVIERHRRRRGAGVPGVSQCQVLEINEQEILATNANREFGVSVPLDPSVVFLEATLQGRVVQLLGELNDGAYDEFTYDLFSRRQHRAAAALIRDEMGHEQHILSPSVALAFQALGRATAPAPSS